MMKDLGLFVLRVAAGGLMAGHGAQKLFGSFGGNGIEGTGGWLESIGLKPGRSWAMLAGVSEFGGGVLTALGFMHPMGPLAMTGAMAMATGTVHKDKPIWVTSGGAELPVMNMAIAGALILAGPGRISVDAITGYRLPWLFKMMGAAAVVAGVYKGLEATGSPVAQQVADTAQEGIRAVRSRAEETVAA